MVRPEDAAATLVFLHGRGQGPDAAERFAERLGLDELALVAPAAPERSWYPQRYFDPRPVNEPHLERAHAGVGAALDELAARGVPPERTVLGGFSQGACIALDLMASDPRPLGALLSLCGSLIGADDVRRPAAGSLEGLRALVTGAERDSWVDVEHVRASAQALRDAGAEVELVVLPPGEHRVRDEEVEATRALLADVMRSRP
jgi:predicted esterase